MLLALLARREVFAAFRRSAFTAPKGAGRMKAITVEPGVAGSVSLQDFPEPDAAAGEVLVETVSIGVCGTDREILAGDYGTAPPGQERLVIGHESIGRVLEAPSQSDLKAGDYVVGIVRRPDPAPCANCAAGEWDMCRNGNYTEHGIKGLHGFARERYRAAAEAIVPVDRRLTSLGVLLEPTSVVAKAWEHIERIGQRAVWAPRQVLVTGAGPIGLLAAMLGRQRNLEVHVIDLATDGPKPQLVRDLGAQYHTGDIPSLGLSPDIVLECTGVPQLVFDVMRLATANGIVCLTGVSSGGREIKVDLGSLNRSMVLENNVVFGSVNANRRHYELAATALAQADREWLSRLINRRVPLNEWQSAYKRQPHDVKVVLDFAT
jgi:threonine dehydrogenase-like Zn-dependent dehydrogenase